MNVNSSTSRVTATLPTEQVKMLKQLSLEHRIPSVNFAIRQAVDEYLKQLKKTQYETLMAEALPQNKIKNSQYETLMSDAANDDDFIQRTMSCAEDFAYVDSEVAGEW